MRMPQDFVDAINDAVRAVNPNAGTMVSGSMTLGHEFDEWLGPNALMKYGLDPLPPEAQAAFNAKFAERRDALKASIVSTAVETARQRVAGTLKPFSFNDSYRTAEPGPEQTNGERDRG